MNEADRAFLKELAGLRAKWLARGTFHYPEEVEFLEGFPRLIALIEEGEEREAGLRACLNECADDLEGMVNMHHGDPSPSEHPVTARKRYRDMGSVRRARDALSTAKE